MEVGVPSCAAQWRVSRVEDVRTAQSPMKPLTSGQQSERHDVTETPPHADSDARQSMHTLVTAASKSYYVVNNINK